MSNPFPALALPDDCPAENRQALAGLQLALQQLPGSRHTAAAYWQDAGVLLALAGGAPLASLQLRDVQGFVRRLSSRGEAPASIGRRLAGWRWCFQVLMVQQPALYLHNPAHGIRAPRKAKPLPVSLPVDNMSGFLQHVTGGDVASLRDRALFELAYSCGLRVAELVGVNLSDFSGDRGLLLVRGKGGKQRQVPVGSHAQTALAHWLDARRALPLAEPQALFVNQRGQRLSVRSVQLRIKHWGVVQNVAADLHPHLLRHACGSHFLQSSQDLRATQELLGHASIQSTQLYTHLDYQHLAEVYDAAHPRAKLDAPDPAPPAKPTA